MYKRKEQIAEENLDWEKAQNKKIEKNTQTGATVTLPPSFQSKQNIWKSIAKFDMQKKSKHFLERNMQFSSFMGILVLPYFVGFVIAYFLFYTYGNMSLMRFLNIDKEFFIMHLWSIGAYIFITLWVCWAFIYILKSSKRLHSS